MARKYKPFPQAPKIWADFVQIRLEIFYKALEALNISSSFENEFQISAALCPEIRKQCFKHKDKPACPSWERPKMPMTNEEVLQAREAKRPDFTSNLVDVNAESYVLHEIYLHIECKCIGIIKPSWNLNVNYVRNGVARFDALSHKYGEQAFDGIMIGYIISSTKEEIQKSINKELPKNIEKLNFTTENKVEQMTTKFIRENVQPYSFNLHHIWADFRKPIIPKKISC